MTDSDFIIITRFCYRFKESDPLETIIKSDYWTNRLNLFKKFCLPCVLAQKYQKFKWILIIDPLLPENYFHELQNLTQMYSNIIIYRWSYTDHLSDPTWINKITPLNNPILITTRLDSDDSIASDFTQKIVQHAKNTKINGFLLISYAKGYTWNDSFDSKYPAGIFKFCRLAMSAQGQTLIAYRERYNMTVHIGNHRKLLSYLKDPINHKLLKTVYEKNGEINLHPNLLKKLAQKRCLIINNSPPMYIRTIHDNNHQQNLRKQMTASTNLSVIKNRFALDFIN